MDKLSRIFETYKMQPAEAAAKSRTWYAQQIAMLGNMRPSYIMKNRDEIKSVGRITPGSMYLFEYSALHAATLPYYDRYPLIIPYKATKNAFYGINLHYLQPQLRVMLLDKLMVFATDKNLNENSKLKFTWQMAAHAASNKYIKSCVKMYLINQVRSQYFKITPENWVAALMLPIERFTNTSKSNVWRESRKV